MLDVLLKVIRAIHEDETGVTLVEYGIAMLLALTLGGGALAILTGEIGATMDLARSLMSQARIEAGG